MYRIVSLSIISILLALRSAGASLSVSVSDAESGLPVEFAALALSAPGKADVGALADERGRCVLRADAGRWTLTVNAVGYARASRSIALKSSGDSVAVVLIPAVKQMDEVVVTARESQGPTSASLIDRQAMAHLQPSSFTELMELLPGAVSKDPQMGKANLAAIRQAANIEADGYDTSSLGTSFVVDGVPVNTNAQMQATPDDTRAKRMTTGKGVDMRSISTDDIESVEVVRGIPSAEYGEVTSGLVNIKRKQGVTALEARFKADIQSQLFYIGKGIKLPGNDWTANFGIDYLDSRIDPRNNRDSFKRLTASLRSNKKWTGGNITTTWNSSLNFSGTFERDKNDPDLTVNNTIDYYTSDRNEVSWNNVVVFLSPKPRFFHNLTLTTGLNYTSEHLRQQKSIAPGRLYPMPVSTTPGDHYVGYLPMSYVADLDVYGKPLTAFAKAAARFRYTFPGASNTLKAGLEWNFSKNFGCGEVYDLTRPITAGNTERPRPFNDIPAMEQLSAYVEHVSDLRIGQWGAELSLGLRETQLLGLDSRYRLSNRPHFDPRVNLKVSLPSPFAGGYPVGIEIAGGFGWHTKMPVAAYLFPNLRYTDYAQLNYYHDREEYRAMNVRTFVEDITNYDLRAARNFKWEVRTDITYRGNRLSATYFHEDMTDAFRMAPSVRFYAYNRYDASGFDPEAAGGAPTIDALPSTVEKRVAVVSAASNSSRVRKQGVEYTFSSVRIPLIRTRVTISGAWFETILSNSEPLWYKPSAVVNGVELQYAALYDDREGNRYTSCNTNITLDTDVPSLGLNFSLSVQNMWFTTRQALRRSGIPTIYVDADGATHTWDEACAEDPYLRHLVRTYTETAFDEIRVPTATTFNIKATKKFWSDRIGIALYVNRIATIAPDYYQYGALQRRYSSPYFGMELNLKL